MLEPSGLYYPNRIARLMLVASADVMGLSGFNSILSMAGLQSYIDHLPPDNLARQFDFAYVAAISQTLEEVYGTRGGRSIALRIGRAMVQGGLHHFGMLAGLAADEFQQLPLFKRAEIGLQALAAVFTRFSDQTSQVAEEDQHFVFSAEPSPMAWGRNVDQPVSHMLAGIIQEALHYATQGFEYHVYELPPDDYDTDRAVFRINKQPIGGVSLG